MCPGSLVEASANPVDRWRHAKPPAGGNASAEQAICVGDEGARCWPTVNMVTPTTLPLTTSRDRIVANGRVHDDERLRLVGAGLVCL